MARAPKQPPNSVKARAMKRARELGTSLRQVYERAGVGKDYLDYEPKDGHADSKLRAVARELNWTIDQLLGRSETAVSPGIQPDSAEDATLFEMAARLSAGILKDETVPASEYDALNARMTRFIYFGLRGLVSRGMGADETAASVWAALLVKELTTS